MPRVRRRGHRLRSELPETHLDCVERAKEATDAELCDWIQVSGDPRADLDKWDRYDLEFTAKFELDRRARENAAAKKAAAVIAINAR